MKRTLYITAALLLLSIGAGAQNVSDFQRQRQQMLDGFQSFRKSVLDDYASFLDGVWRDYEAFAGEKVPRKPKPVTVPRMEPQQDTAPVVLPKPQESDNGRVKPQESDNGMAGSQAGTPMPQQPKVVSPAVPSKPVASFTQMDFYGMRLRVPQIEVVRGSQDKGDIARAWKTYQKNGGKDVAAQLKLVAEAYCLNDWFTIDLARKYADQMAAAGCNADRVTLQHFLIANMGYEVRLAKTDSQLMLMIPFDATIYSRSFMKEGNKKLYVFTDEKDGIEFRSGSFSTCDLPEGADLGKVAGVGFGRPMKIGGAMKSRVLSDRVLSVSCEVDETMMRMVRDYPITSVPDFARANLMPNQRKAILEQLRPAIEGLSEQEAANKLLHFCQYCFEYATDDEQFGREKYFFFEESIYYPKNDCEDRSIFFAYLVRNLLGLDVHLIEFPGHECTAVRFTQPLQGDSYEYKGQRYYICDPTYIGAKIGMCARQYRSETPKIELW